MTKESKIKESQQAQLIKAVQERDLFLQNPQIKELKDCITDEIHLYLNGKDKINDSITKLKVKLTQEKEYLDVIEKELKRYAKIAYTLQQNGIFWADTEFVVKKPQEPKLDRQAMFHALTPEQQEQYLTRTKVIVEKEEVTINWDKLIATEPKIYTNPLPQIAHKAKKETKDYDFE